MKYSKILALIIIMNNIGICSDKINNELNRSKANKKVYLYSLGESYLYGYGVARNEKKAVSAIRKSAQLGYYPAQLFMAKYNLTILKNIKKSFLWFKLLADKGDMQATMYVAASYFHGYGVVKSENNARRYYVKAAENGSAIAQYYLAKYFLNSKSLEDKKLGVLWLKRSIKRRNEKAFYELGMLYYNGNHVNKNIKKAIDLLTKSANLGNINAMIFLSLYYKKQNPSDSLNSKKWLHKALNKNNKKSEYLIGKDLINGNQIEIEHGISWLNQSADKDYLPAMKKLSFIYSGGILTKKNIELSNYWKKRASEKKGLSKRKKVNLWLSNGKSVDNSDEYKLTGIISQWRNPSTLKNNIINQEPRLPNIKSKDVFLNKFNLLIPEKINVIQIVHNLLKKWISKPYQTMSVPKRIPKIYKSEKKTEEARLIDYIVINFTHEEVSEYKINKLKNSSTLFTHEEASEYKINKLKNSSTLGNKEAMYELSKILMNHPFSNKKRHEGLDLLEQSASLGYNLAQYELGSAYLQGTYVQKNISKGISLLEEAAIKGNENAQYMLAKFFKSNQQYEYAFGYYALAADKINKAKYELANLYLNQKTTSPLLSLSNKQIVKYYEDSVKNGVKEAVLPLAYFYLTSKDKKKQEWAFDVALIFHKHGISYGTFLLSLFYMHGINCKKDKKYALNLLESIKNNIPMAEFILGTNYYTGTILKKNTNKGLELLKSAANKSNSYASYNIGIINYHKGFLKKFIKEMKLSFKQGNTLAGNTLGDFYFNKRNVSNNLKKSAMFYKKSAIEGNNNAQLKLGYFFQNDIFFTKDYKKAIKWYKKSAKQGNAVAQYFLGKLYYIGVDGGSNFLLSKKWFMKAANNNYIPAMVGLGYIYERMKHDYGSALKWYEKSSEKNSPIGDYNLALMYEYGKGMPLDFQNAYILYTTASDAGYYPAFYTLGMLYINGLGIDKNKDIGFRLLKKSAKKGNSLAKEFLLKQKLEIQN